MQSSELFNDYLKWLYFGFFIYVVFSFPAIYAAVSSFISIICAEFRALSDDFVDDVNKYQLPVVKHYVSAHWKMSFAFLRFRRSLRLI